MKKIAYICCNCKKAHYNESEVNPIKNELYVCKDVFACKGRFLNQNKNVKFTKE